MARQATRRQGAHPQLRPEPLLAPRIRIRVWINLGTTPLLGPGRAALLEAIAETGSISAAGRALRMSYRKAWTLVTSMNSAAPWPLVERATGGAGGGGASLTPQGQRLVQAFRALEADLEARGQRAETQLARDVVSARGRRAPSPARHKGNKTR